MIYIVACYKCWLAHIHSMLSQDMALLLSCRSEGRWQCLCLQLRIKERLSFLTASFTNDVFYIWAATCDFQQCGILTSVHSDEPVQPLFKFRNSKWCSVSSLTLVEYSATSKGSDQTAHMRRLIWGFAGRTYHIVGNFMSRLNFLYLGWYKFTIACKLRSSYLWWKVDSSFSTSHIKVNIAELFWHRTIAHEQGLIPSSTNYVYFSRGYNFDTCNT